MLYVAYFPTQGLKVLHAESRIDADWRFTCRAGGVAPLWLAQLARRDVDTVGSLRFLGWRGSRVEYDAELEQARRFGLV